MGNTRLYRQLVLLGILLAVASCSSSPEAPVSSSSPAPQSSAVPTPSGTPQAEKAPTSNKPLQSNVNTATGSSTAGAGDTVPVTLYRADSQCLNLVPEKVTVPATRSLNSAVDKILQQQTHVDLDVSGYKVSVNQGVATVDLQISPRSKRSLESLSSCEQLELFSSLRKTLTSNAQWKINSVRFTEKGEEVVL